ncbi:WD40 repeat-like protein [Laetiporus sulphureus 93-53]|uniref:WD40 repeat-like protein n=1 Tax=Laetiporus sulphureus 93-53 TaxID=1314785 RepID=A0A165CKW2_9APHY|nr:WD40 repeat-like protein [Laetiporus sulphureus 93-53]KZT02993.1 WD40 repeat-like protein [Laetiporus sulphureus 93-53]
MSSSIYNHKHLQPTGASTQGPSQQHSSHARLNDGFETIRAEFNMLIQELDMFRTQRDDLDNKVTGQVNELNIIRQSLYELETQHGKIRQQYEDEIRALRTELHALRSQGRDNLGLASLGRDREARDLRDRDGDIRMAPAPGVPIPRPQEAAPLPLTPVGPAGPGAAFDPFYSRDRERERDRDRERILNERDRERIERERATAMDRERERERAERERADRERGEVKRIKTERMKSDRGGDPFSPSLNPLAHTPHHAHAIAHAQQSISLGPAVPPSASSTSGPTALPTPPVSTPAGQVTPKLPPTPGVGMGVAMPLPPPPTYVTQGAREGPATQGPGREAPQQVREREARDVSMREREGPIRDSREGPMREREGPMPVRDREGREEREVNGTGNPPFPTLPPSSSNAIPPASLPAPPAHVSSSTALVPAAPAPTSPAAPTNPEAGTELSMDPMAVPPEFKKEGADWFAVFNPNAAGAGKEKKRTLDVNLVHTLMHESVVCCVRFSADGKYLATGCNRTAQIYDTKTGQKTCVLVDEAASKTGDLYIRSVCFSPDGKLLATGAEDKQIRIWDIAKKRIRNVFDGHQQEIYSLDFSKDGRLIVSGSGDKTARIWDMQEGVLSKVLSINENEGDAGVTSVCISPDGRFVAAGSLDTIVRIWDVTTGQLVERLKGHRDSVYSVAFTPDGKGLVSGSLDKTLKYWDIRPILSGRKGEKGSQCTMNFTGHKDYVLSVAVSHDGQWVVSGSKDRGVQFWDAKTAVAHCMLQGHKNSVISIDLSPAGNILATGSGDWQARIWNYTAL